MGKIVLNREKSQQRPAPRQAQWYDDRQALIRVYPKNQTLRVPEYDPENNKDKFLAEFKSLYDRLVELKRSLNATENEDKITGFYRNILKRLAPNDSSVSSMEGSKFSSLTHVDLTWIKKNLEIIIDYIARNKDKTRLESIINTLAVCSGGITDDLRRQANLCLETEGLLEVLAESRILTIDVITQEHIIDRNRKAVTQRRGITQSEEAFEKHIPIVFLKIAKEMNIDIPSSAMGSASNREDASVNHDIYSIDVVRHGNQYSFNLDTDQKRHRANAMNFTGYNVNSFPQVFFNTYGEVALETLANHLEKVIKKLFENGIENKELDEAAEDPFKLIPALLIAKYKASQEDLEAVNELLFSYDEETNKSKPKSSTEFLYWCRVIAAQILVKNGIAQPYETLDLGNGLAMVKANDLTYFTLNDVIIKPADMVKHAHQKNTLYFLIELALTIKNKEDKPEFIGIEILLQAQALKISGQEALEQYERWVAQKPQRDKEKAERVEKIEKLIKEENDKNEDKDQDDIERWRKQIDGLKQPEQQMKRPVSNIFEHSMLGSLERFYLDATEEQQKTLLEYGLDFLVPVNHQGETILHLAIKNEMTDQIDICLEKLTETNKLQIAQDIALELKNIGLTIKLIQKGVHPTDYKCLIKLAYSTRNIQLIEAIFDTKLHKDEDIDDELGDWLLENHPALFSKMLNGVSIEKVNYDNYSKYRDITESVFNRINPTILERIKILSALENLIYSPTKSNISHIQNLAENGTLEKHGDLIICPLSEAGINQFHLAIKDKRNVLLPHFFKINPQVINSATKAGMRPIDLAIKARNVEAVRFLIDAKACPDPELPLLSFLLGEDRELYVKYLNTLSTEQITFEVVEHLSNFVDVTPPKLNPTISKRINLLTNLYVSCRFKDMSNKEQIFNFINNGVLAQNKDALMLPINKQNQTIIHLAIKYGWNDLFAAFYETNHRSIRSADSDHKNPIDYAIGAGNIEALNIIIDKTDSFDHQVMLFAIKSGNEELVKKLYKRKKSDSTYLTDALTSNKTMIKLLIELGEDPTKQFKERESVNNKKTSIFEHLIMDNMVDEIRLSHQKFPDIMNKRSRSDFNCHPIFVAIEHGNLETLKCISELTEMPMTIYKKNPFAFCISNGSPDLIARLVILLAQPQLAYYINALNNEADTCLDLALQIKDVDQNRAVTKLLLEKNAEPSPHLNDTARRTYTKIIDNAIESGNIEALNFIIDKTKIFSHKAMLFAIKSGNEELVRKLYKLNNSASTYLTDAFTSNKTMIKLLIELGEDPSKQFKERESVNNKKTSIFEHLIMDNMVDEIRLSHQKFPDIMKERSRSDFYYHPIIVAIEHGNLETLKCISELTENPPSMNGYRINLVAFCIFIEAPDLIARLEILLAHPKFLPLINDINKEGVSCLDLALQIKDVDQNRAVTKLLLEKNAEPSPYLNSTARQTYTKIIDNAIESGNIEALNFIIDKTKIFSHEAMLFAIKSGNEELVRKLHKLNDSGSTYLTDALTSNKTMIKLLIELGEDPGKQFKERKSVTIKKLSIFDNFIMDNMVDEIRLSHQKFPDIMEERSRSDFNYHPIFVAIEHGNLETLKCISELTENPPPMKRYRKNLVAFCISIEAPDLIARLEILLAHPKFSPLINDVNLIDDRNKEGLPCLDLALQIKDVNQYRAVTRLLFEKGAQMSSLLTTSNVTNHMKLIDNAIKADNIEALNFIIDKTKIFSHEAMLFAIKSGNEELVRKLYKLNNSASTYLTDAFTSNKTMIKLLIELGEDPRKQFKDKMRSIFEHLIMDNMVDEILLSHQKFPNIIGERSSSVSKCHPIFMAIKHGNLETLAFISQLTEDSPPMDGYKYNPLAFCVSIGSPDLIERLKILLDHPKLVVLINDMNNGVSCFHLALQIKDVNQKHAVTRLLLEKGAQITSVLDSILRQSENLSSIKPLLSDLSGAINPSQLLNYPNLDKIYQCYRSNFGELCQIIRIDTNGIDALKIYAQAELCRFKKKPAVEQATYAAKIAAIENGIQANDGQVIIKALKMHHVGSFRTVFNFELRYSESYANLPDCLKVVNWQAHAAPDVKADIR